MSPREPHAKTAPARRAYNRFCPLSQALDQVGDRWTLHIITALLSGPKRYTDLKRVLAGAGTNILSDRLRDLAANRLVTRTTGDAPGSETTYRLTERGAQLGPVIAALATWGLDLLSWTAPGSEEKEREVFDRPWAVDNDRETYQWVIDGVEFQLAASGDELTQSRGRAKRPAVTLETTNATLSDIVTGRRTVAESLAAKQLQLNGSKPAIERMFKAIAFPLVRLGL
jgi:DNA-binding HxlR family transcriptional regulator